MVMSSMHRIDFWGVSVLSEVTMTEQAKTRHNSRLASFNQIFSKQRYNIQKTFQGHW